MSEKIPMVEVFQTVEGEGTNAGYPTTFVRVFNCNLRCTWCDTPYSYAPAKPEYLATIPEIVEQVKQYPSRYICLTGGEPLIHGEKSAKLIEALAAIPYVKDIHIETNGAIHLQPFQEMREQYDDIAQKVRFVIDYKLPASGENDKMIHENFDILQAQDEIKFVIADDADFLFAKQIVAQYIQKGTPLFSPVWETMPPAKLVERLLEHQLMDVKLNLQIHKVIWDPDQRGV
ncbi:radical SAM protein [Hazenella sp. IB182357]|uniref:7-carboxy-7-deazaguanine synthase n=1 Tax=Polycladospora coralii TaxID=2771432 RepID=A0A926RUU7_9BACL|nr:radical SAM protein [Polycladospora coralii]MBD1373423.1 radical SAM protein [Polycladospora coralii]